MAMREQIIDKRDRAYATGRREDARARLASTLMAPEPGKTGFVLGDCVVYKP